MTVIDASYLYEAETAESTVIAHRSIVAAMEIMAFTSMQRYKDNAYAITVDVALLLAVPSRCGRNNGNRGKIWIDELAFVCVLGCVCVGASISQRAPQSERTSTEATHSAIG